ncbi:30S ribosomal protein S6e [Candidatus Pacearchaeota archaeon]|nr:30S ribosomal protein S6e [Candidatus Pacearchaeota archaeon]
MAFKINIGDKGRTFKLEVNTESLIGKKIGEAIEGKELKPELEGYELEITGTSDIAGFPGAKNIDSSGLKKVLLKKGFAMKGYKKRRKTSIKIKGLRLKKTLRGSIISKDVVQINTKVKKAGNKKLEEVFAEQIKAKEEKPAEQTAEIKSEEKK